jgi:hypothetical protein
VIAIILICQTVQKTPASDRRVNGRYNKIRTAAKMKGWALDLWRHLFTAQSRHRRVNKPFLSSLPPVFFLFPDNTLFFPRPSTSFLDDAQTFPLFETTHSFQSVSSVDRYFINSSSRHYSPSLQSKKVVDIIN